MDIFFVSKSRDSELLGIMSISSLLKKEGFKIYFLEVESAYNLLREKINDPKRTILAYSTPTVFSKMLLDLNRQLKSQFPHVFSVFGGSHPTFFPEMIEEEGVDGVCIGEGEHAMLELVKNLREGRPITHIQNWWIKQDGKIYKNPLRPLIEDLDSLPFLDRSYSKNMPSFKMGKALVITSRGCPYKCSYCFNHAYNRLYNNPSGRVRRRSVDNVIEEIRQLKQNYQIKFIDFEDDVFVLSEKWVEEFSYQYKKEIGLPFCCYVRANLINQGIVKNLKNAGCVRVSMGIECGDDYYLNSILKRKMNIDTILSASEIIKRNGINLRTTNILGLPGSSLDVDLKTLRLNIKCKVDYARAAILSPYPGTDIYDLAKQFDLLDDTLESTTVGANWSLVRKYKNAREKRRLENLSALFSLAVQFRFPLSLTKFLLELPITKFFAALELLDNLHRVYFYKIPKVNEGPLLIRFIRLIRISKDILKLYINGHMVKQYRDKQKK